MKMYVPLCFTVMISLKIHSAMNVHASPCSSFCCVAAESLWYFQSNKKLLNSSLQRCVKFCPKVASTAFQMKTTQTTIETQRRELVKFSCNWSSTVVNRLGKSPLGFGVFFFFSFGCSYTKVITGTSITWNVIPFECYYWWRWYSSLIFPQKR